MNVPRKVMTLGVTVALVVFSSSLFDSWAKPSLAGGRISSQVDERERAIKLFEQGDAAGAVNALQPVVKKQKKDIRAWHYLGLAYGQIGNQREALNAHEKATKIGLQLAKDQSKGESSPAALSQRFMPVAIELADAADSADKFLELSSKMSRSKTEEWRSRAEILRGYAEFSKELKDNHVYGLLEVGTKARIISKPNPGYSEDARANNVTGRVALLLILSADGSIKGFIPVKSLSNGLTEESIRVARKITFVPAMLNGKPVSQLLRVEYSFNIY